MAVLPWILATIVLTANNSPAVGQIGAFYFENVGTHSELWIRLVPQGVERGPDPFQLNVTVSFPGRQLEHQPDAVELRVESTVGSFPDRVRQPLFSLLLGNAELNLAGTQYSFQFLAKCQDCSADTVTARVPFSVLRDMTASKTVVIKALGFSARLTPADLAALGKYVATLSSGVAIK